MANGHLVNIPELATLYGMDCFRIGVHSRECSSEKDVERNAKTHLNRLIVVDSRSP